MKFAYYPGCSARSTCAELNVATHRVAAKLGLDLLQLESATCTGARELRAIDPVGLLYAQRAHPRARGARGAAADDDLQHLHAQFARCACGVRQR